MSVVATYNYVRLYSSWHESFVVLNGVITSTGVPCTDRFRYADWLTTMPLLLVACVSVLDLPARQIRLRSKVLALLGAEMIALGYFGQIATNFETRWVWFGVGMIPFIIIMIQLYSNLAKAIEAEPAGARTAIKLARLGLLLSWPIYAIVSPANRLSSLTVSQLRGILTGRLTDWSQVGGVPGPIHVVVMNQDDAAGAPQDILAGQDDVVGAAFRVPNEQTLAAAVAADSANIGFARFGNTGSAKVLAVAEDGASPIVPTD